MSQIIQRLIASTNSFHLLALQTLPTTNYKSEKEISLLASQQEIRKKIKGRKRNTAVGKQTAGITATGYIRVGLRAEHLISSAYEQYPDTFT